MDWVSLMFPGNGFAIPDTAERDRADELIAEWSLRLGEKAIKINRVVCFADANYPTNRAYMRAKLRGWWAKGL